MTTEEVAGGFETVHHLQWGTPATWNRFVTRLMQGKVSPPLYVR